MRALTPRELYEDPMLRLDLEEHWHSSTSVDTVLESLDVLAEETSLVEYMDRLEDNDLDSWLLGKTALVWLPPETLAEQYGAETLLWAAANSVFTRAADKHRAALEPVGGYDLHFFEKARKWCWEQLHTAKGKDILAQYAVLSTVFDEGFESVELPALMGQSTLGSVVLRSEQLAAYGLAPITAKGDKNTGYAEEISDNVDPEVFYKVFVDAPAGITLNYKGMPCAIAAVAAVNRDELMIYQLQGVRGNKLVRREGAAVTYEVVPVRSRGLWQLDMQRLMVGVVGQIAEHMGKRSVAIQQGAKNFWATYIVNGETAPHLSPESAFKAYDEQALRLGFERGNDGNWHMPVPLDLQSIRQTD